MQLLDQTLILTNFGGYSRWIINTFQFHLVEWFITYGSEPPAASFLGRIYAKIRFF